MENLKTVFLGACRWARDFWLLLGASILLLILVEAALSLAFHLWDRSGPPVLDLYERSVAADIYAGVSWAEDYWQELEDSAAIEWRPYVYWRRKPFDGQYIHIDQDGIRRTAHAESSSSRGTPIKIFMFGGSTVWGRGARDEFTIPSILAKRLGEAGLAVEVTNFGEVGYVNTQELMTLMLKLQQGHVPDLVIFYDGVNDTYSAFQHQVAGLPHNEINRVLDFNLSAPEEAGRRHRLLLEDTTKRMATVRLTRGLMRRLGIGGDAESAPGFGATPAVWARAKEVPDLDNLAQDVVNRYAKNIEAVAALGQHYEFESLFYWQPMLFQKSELSESELAELDRRGNLVSIFQKTYEAVGRSRLEASESYRFHDVSQLFADVAEPIFIDWCHTGKVGNEKIAERLLRDVFALLDEP